MTPRRSRSRVPTRRPRRRAFRPVGGPVTALPPSSYNTRMAPVTLAVVGVGLIGGSVALAARAAGVARRVVGCGPDADALDRARRRGTLDAVAADPADAVRDADLVVVAVPVPAVAAAVRRLAPHARPGTVVTDVASTKAGLVADLDRDPPPNVRFVGGHPLAGSEKSGPDHARADLFAGRVCVLTPTGRTDPAAVGVVAGFWQALGATVRTLTPAGHDRVLAETSHLPHVAASALAGLLADDRRPFAATGFRDATRLAAGDAALWTGILRGNAAELVPALDRLAERLAAFRAALAAGDEAGAVRFVDPRQAGARCSGKLRFGRSAGTPSASACATSSTC